MPLLNHVNKKGTAGFVMFFLVIILIRGLRLLSRAGKAL